MREDLCGRAGIVCPRCRRPGAEGMLQAPLRIGEVFRSKDGFIRDGLLECADPVCGATYPVLDGVPVVLKDVGAWWRGARTALSGVRSDDPGIRGYFEALTDGGPAEIDRRALLGSYMEFHYGEFSGDGPAPAPDDGALNRSYWSVVTRMARPEGGGTHARSVDLGCSVGRFTFEAARYSDLAVGIDADFANVSAAVRIQRERTVAYERRERGRVFRRVEASFDPPRNALFLVADALDPPFPAGSFDLVGALNLLDNVGVPLTLLGQMDALLRGGGRMVLGAPYEWRGEIADPAEWLETDVLDAPALLREILAGRAADRLGFRYSVEEEIGELPWVLRGHARRWTVFRSHVTRARKGPGPGHGREAA